ncbi:MAG: hypothetical protein GY873_02650 [Bosea sp.]|uniref:hypothetical protein n=1 Tax=Bosea sp. (in: a-proteobacteria) TaxID=1871050 RepID=UPI0023A0A9D1|nr:hypothetical protein [Bosea sp. (in: a-proteobacteria)]MCP4733069.1 hypothetical protein [Bosea sp. (in: a-proteobacteria)]
MTIEPDPNSDDARSGGDPGSVFPARKEGPDAETPDDPLRPPASLALRRMRAQAIWFVAFVFTFFTLMQLLLIRTGFDAMASAKTSLEALRLHSFGDLVSMITGSILFLAAGVALLVYTAVALSLLARQMLDLMAALFAATSDLVFPKAKPRSQIEADPSDGFIESARRDWLSATAFTVNVVVATVNGLIVLFSKRT